MDDLDLGATLKGFSPGQKVLGRYTLNKALGRGGMGVVWLARDEELGRDTALKFLPELVAMDQAAVADLKREVRRAIDLAHPHIVKIHDFVGDGRTAAVSMEYIAGGTFSALRLEEPGQVFGVEKLAPWVAQLCGALDYAHHDAQVVHRDLKPTNLMLDARGRLKVLDFGIAASISDSVSRASNKGSTSGTPVYMSPQQMFGEDPAITDDVYALGATLFELLAGKPPFHSGNIVLQVQSKAAPLLNERRAAGGHAPVPVEWEQTIAACLAKEPKDRPQSAGEVAERLGLAPAANTQRPTSTVQSAPAKPAEVGRVVPNTTSERRTEESPSARETGKKSKSPLLAALAAVVIVLGGAGYYFGSYAPEQKRLAEIKRLEDEGRAVEAERLRNEKEKADAAAKEKAEQEQQAYAIVAARVDALLDGAPVAQHDAAGQAVQEYLKIAPARFRSEIEARWTKRSAAWETHRLSLARGGFRIRTDPEGAEVQVGSLALENSPVVLNDVRLGKYPVTIRADGYEDWKGEIEVKENDFADPGVIALVRSTGGLNVASDPVGAEFTLNQQGGEGVGKSGTLPVKLEGLPTGSYVLTAAVAGLADVTREVDIVRGTVAPVDLRFEYGSLEVTSIPSGAEVWADKQLLGRTPLKLGPIATGDLELNLKAKGHARQKLAGTVVSGQTLTLAATLKKGGYDNPLELAEAVLEQALKEADPSIRASRIQGVVQTLLRLGGAPKETLKAMLLQELEAIRAISNPDKQLTQLSFSVELAAEVDDDIARLWTEQMVTQVPRITSVEDQRTATAFLGKFWMQPQIADRAVTAMESWFQGNDDDWVYLSNVAQLHQRFGNSQRAATVAARANGPYRKDVIDNGLQAAANQRRADPVLRSLLKGDLTAAQRQVAALAPPLDYSATVDLANQFMQAGDFDTARQLSRLLENTYQVHFPGMLITYALLQQNYGFAENIAATLTDTGDSSTRSDAYRSLAEHYLRVGLKDQARVAANQIRSFGNEQYGFNKQQAVPVLVQVGDLARARQIAQSVANPFDPEKAYLWGYNALMFFSVGDMNSYHRALQMNNGADRQQASDMFVAFQLVPLLCGLGRIDEAEKVLPQVSDRNFRNGGQSTILLHRLRSTPEDDYDALVDAAPPGEPRATVLGSILFLMLEKKQRAQAGL